MRKIVLLGIILVLTVAAVPFCVWAEEVTPTPTPTPEPTPYVDLSAIEESQQTLLDEFGVLFCVVVFGLGLIGGLLSGQAFSFWKW